MFAPLEADRKGNMKGRAYPYLTIIGVASQFQGYGGELLGALVEESERARMPIYLETAVERNVSWYERLGFKLVNRVTLPVVNLPQWEMVREMLY